MSHADFHFSVITAGKVHLYKKQKKILTAQATVINTQTYLKQSPNARIMNQTGCHRQYPLNKSTVSLRYMRCTQWKFFKRISIQLYAVFLFIE